MRRLYGFEPLEFGDSFAYFPQAVTVFPGYLLAERSILVVTQFNDAADPLGFKTWVQIPTTLSGQHDGVRHNQA